MFIRSQVLFFFFSNNRKFHRQRYCNSSFVSSSYLSFHDIVHRDLKTGNVLVDNSYYNSTLESVEMCRGIFNEKPIICKLGDLGEGKSQAMQTKTVVSNVTNMVNRDSPAFLAPEISLDQYMLETAS